MTPTAGPTRIAFARRLRTRLGLVVVAAVVVALAGTPMSGSAAASKPSSTPS